MKRRRDRLAVSWGLIVVGGLGSGLETRAETADPPLAHWRFETVTPGGTLEAADGVARRVVEDVSGHGNALRTFNTDLRTWPPDTSPSFSASVPATRLASGKPNEASLRFEGFQDVYTDGEPIESARLEAFTIEAAVRLDPPDSRTRGAYRVVVGKDGQPLEAHANAPLQLVIAGRSDEWTTADAPALQILDAAGEFHSASSDRPIPPDTWVWLAGVCDGRSLKLYVDRGKGYQLEGQREGISGGLVVSEDQWTVGRGAHHGRPGMWMHGWIDEVRVHDRALQPAAFLGVDREGEPVPPEASGLEPQSFRHLVKELADPSLLRHDGRYYLYGTTAVNRGFRAYSSADLIEWRDEGLAYRDSDGAWGQEHFWAPSVVELDGRFLMAFSATGVLPDTGGRKSLRIVVAEADHPAGPFVPVASPTGSPVLSVGMSTIDAELFVDRSAAKGERLFLYYALDKSEAERSRIFVARLDEQRLTAVGEPTPCIEPSRRWENGDWNEAPYVLQRDGWYVLLYSANPWFTDEYAVGYAVARSPRGPWVKPPDNRVLGREMGLRGPGHCGLSPREDGGWWIVFHALTDEGRDAYLGRLDLEPDARFGLRPVVRGVQKSERNRGDEL